MYSVTSAPSVSQLVYIQETANTRFTVVAATSSRDQFWNKLFLRIRSSGSISNEPVFSNAMLSRLHTFCAL